jgi:peptidoglycan/xylan/chitin deacetylase (PgdA/CDA1 family)
MVVFWPRPVLWALEQAAPEVVFSVETERQVVALTLDDGPDPTATPQILDLLEEHGAKATFFVIGERIPGNESLLARMVEEGHELGNHGLREQPAILLSTEDLEHSIDSTAAVLAGFGSVRWYRPGSGAFDMEMVDVVQRRGLEMALGSIYPFDTAIENPDLSSAYILGHVEPGSIIVLHEHNDHGIRTVETLRTVLPELDRRGFTVVDLTTLVHSAQRE